MKDVLGYEGKRVIVTGAGTAVGIATTALLVELGAEVHAVDATKPDVAGIASFSECDLDDRVQVDDTMKRIGAYVNALFNCVPAEAVTMRYLGQAVVPLLLPASAVVNVMTTDGEAVFAGGDDVRSNCVRIGPNTAEATAWLLVFLNSPRAVAVNGAILVAS